MPIPTSRHELLGLVRDAYAGLEKELGRGGPELADAVGVDEWTVKELLAIRLWWTERVVEWIEAGRRGEVPELPAPGFGWNETPRLNAEIAARAADERYGEILGRLEAGFGRVLATIESLDERELLEPGIFEWAGKWPVSRWISINTARQYNTARTYVRRALRRRETT